MKHLIKLIIMVTVVSFGGCYTVLWSPQEQLPEENNTQIYYSEPYYGDYNYYYDNPWWITGRPIYAVPPGEVQSSERSPASVDRNSNVTTTRNNNGSRNAPDNNGSVIKTGTPTRNTNSSNDNPVYKDNKSNNSGEQTRSSENSRSNEGNNSARNNNGNRNSGNGRR